MYNYYMVLVTFNKLKQLKQLNYIEISWNELFLLNKMSFLYKILLSWWYIYKINHYFAINNIIFLKIK
jgi:hypothetical protein